MRRSNTLHRAQHPPAGRGVKETGPCGRVRQGLRGNPCDALVRRKPFLHGKTAVLRDCCDITGMLADSPSTLAGQNRPSAEYGWVSHREACALVMGAYRPLCWRWPRPLAAPVTAARPIACHQSRTGPGPCPLAPLRLALPTYFGAGGDGAMAAPLASPTCALPRPCRPGSAASSLFGHRAPTGSARHEPLRPIRVRTPSVAAQYGMTGAPAPERLGHGLRHQASLTPARAADATGVADLALKSPSCAACNGT